MGDGLIRAHIAASGLKVGDVIADNDPRMPGRKLQINGFDSEGDKVFARCTNAPLRSNCYVRLDRIHTDGKPRRSGFSLVKAEDTAASTAQS